MFKGLLQLVVLAILTYTATADDDKPKVWSGNLQFSEEGFLKDDDVRRIQKEIQVISRYFQQLFNHKYGHMFIIDHIYNLLIYI